MARLAAGVLALILGVASGVQAATLDDIKSSKTIRIGYRSDALPFSFIDDLGEPTGYSVNLCRAVASGLKAELGLDQVKVDYVKVSATDRFDAVKDHKIDLLCEATTMTLGRMDQVDFSLQTFITGGSLLYRANGPSTFKELDGKKVGVLPGTTTQALLTKELKKAGINAQIVPVTSHEDGLKKLEDNAISAYFSDRAILVYLYLNSKHQDELKLAAVTISLEPYALALPKGDDAFRAAVDRAIARFYRAGGGEQLFKASFPGADMTDVIKTLYLLNAIPE